jgi:putative FmdB family regulatory protein
MAGNVCEAGGRRAIIFLSATANFRRFARERSRALPLYEYKCVKCGHRFEKIESLSASTKKKCPKCGAKAERQLGAPAIQFKGTGWYVTDYAGKKGAGGASDKSGDGAAEKSSEKPAEKSAESKPAAAGKSESDGAKKKK